MVYKGKSCFEPYQDAAVYLYMHTPQCIAT